MSTNFLYFLNLSENKSPYTNYNFKKKKNYTMFSKLIYYAIEV